MTEPRHIGRYLLQEELGRGGMGVVHAALDEGLGRRVALKLLRTGGPGDDAALGARFEQEMQIAVTLEHPNIVPVHETGTEDGVRYIAMRLVEGEDLGAVLRREGALPPARAARLARQIASALDAAHARGLVHRDVKPANVLLTGAGDEEHAYLTDFGLTRGVDDGLTQTGQWIGTVDYAAPEQIEAQPLSAQTDVYALGCVLYHLLTGTLPFSGSFAAKATGHVSRPLPPVGLTGGIDSAQVDRVLAVATDKLPARRYASAGALARAFARVAEAGEDPSQRTAAFAVPVEDDVTAETAVRKRPLPAGRPRRRTPSVPAAAVPVAAAPPTAATAAEPRSAGSPARDRLPVVAAALGVAAALVLALVLATGGDDGDSSTAKGSGSTGKGVGTSTAKTTSQPASGATTPAPKPAPPAPVVIPTTAYTAPAGGYSARVPAGDGWSAQGEQNLNGILRSRFTGPDGQQLWIDSTPTMPPAFGREGRTVTERKTIDGPLGPIVGYRFTGVPTEFCGGGCVDYQLDLGGRGYAVIAGPTPAARLAARRVILSLQEVAPAAGTAAPAAPGAGPQFGNGKGPGKKDKDGDDG